MNIPNRLTESHGIKIPALERQLAEGIDLLLTCDLALEAVLPRISVERLADRVLILRRGRAVAAGTPAEVVAEYGRANLEEVFLEIAREGRR